MYSRKWYFTTSKLLRSTIPKLITLPHNQERPQNKSTNNCSITLHVNEIHNNLLQKKNNGPSLIRQTDLFSLSRSLSGPLSLGLCLALSAEKIPLPYI